MNALYTLLIIAAWAVAFFAVAMVLYITAVCLIRAALDRDLGKLTQQFERDGTDGGDPFPANVLSNRVHEGELRRD